MYGARRKSNRTRGQCHFSGGKQIVGLQHRPCLSTKDGHGHRHRSGRRHRRGHGQNGSRPSLPYHGVLRTRHGTLTARQSSVRINAQYGSWPCPVLRHWPRPSFKPPLASHVQWRTRCRIGFPFSPLGVPALECKEMPCEREKKKKSLGRAGRWA